MRTLLLIAAALVAIIAPASAAQDGQQQTPDLASAYMAFKKPFTMQACTDRVVHVVRDHTGSELKIDPMPSGVGITAEGVNIVIRCAPDLKAILFMVAGPKEVLGQTLVFYKTMFELEVKLGEQK